MPDFGLDDPEAKRAYDRLNGDLPFTERVALAEAAEAHEVAAKRAATPLGLNGTVETAGHGYARRFPTDRLPTKMRAYVHDLAVRKQVPVDLPALTMLGMLGAVAGPRFIVRRDTDWYEPCNLYTCCGLDSGAGKTPVVAELRRGLWKAKRLLAKRAGDIHAKQIEDLEQRIFALRDRANNINTPVSKRKPLHAEADDLQDELKALTKEGPTVPKLLFDGDITPERLIEKMAANEDVGAIVDDEGTFFRIIAGLYTGGKVGNLGLLLKGWDCGDYEQERVGNGNKQPRNLERAALSLALSPQPAIVASVLRNQMMNDTGFINRFIVCLPGDLVGMRKDRPSTYHRDTPASGSGSGKTGQLWWADLLESIVKYEVIKPAEDPFADPPETLQLTRGAWKRHVAYAAEFEARMHPSTGKLVEIRAWGAKHLGRVLRVAALLHLAANLTSDDEIEESTMLDAVEIGEWSIEHYRAAGGVAGLSEDAGRIKEFLDGSELGFVERSDIYTKVFSRRIAAKVLDAAIAEVCATGHYRVVKQKTAGRPKLYVCMDGISLLPEERPNEAGQPSGGEGDEG